MQVPAHHPHMELIGKKLSGISTVDHLESLRMVSRCASAATDEYIKLESELSEAKDDLKETLHNAADAMKEWTTSRNECGRLRSKITKLVESLERYGRHEYHCTFGDPTRRDTCLMCQCGLMDAIIDGDTDADEDHDRQPVQVEGADAGEPGELPGDGEG